MNGEFWDRRRMRDDVKVRRHRSFFLGAQTAEGGQASPEVRGIVAGSGPPGERTSGCSNRGEDVDQSPIFGPVGRYGEASTSDDVERVVGEAAVCDDNICSDRDRCSRQVFMQVAGMGNQVGVHGVEDVTDECFMIHKRNSTNPIQMVFGSECHA